MTEREEVILRGLPISKGIGIGFPIFFSNDEAEIFEGCVPKKEIEGEILRYRSALERSRKDVERLQQISLRDGPEEIVAILGTHLEMMQDPLLTAVMEEKIRSSQQTIETVFFYLIEEYKQKFNILQDTYFQERVKDIVDVSRRILNHLHPLEKLQMSEMPHNSIILAQELVPTDTIEANASVVSGFVTAVGGITSHAAIIARAKGIPYVANVDIRMLKRVDLQSLIVDGAQGLIIVNPNRQSLKRYAEIKKGVGEKYKLLHSEKHLKVETVDGYEVRLFANLENPKEIELLSKNGASGVGLFRSEYLFLSRRKFPTEEEQFQIYKKMARHLKGAPLVVRVFDVGGDKKLEMFPEEQDAKYFLGLTNELNPALGCRAVRFLLRYPEILKTQLRALLRASRYGDIHILVPLVSDVFELRQVREIFNQMRESLRKEGEKIAKEIPLGCMVEVPSIALMCDAIVKEADFLSIGMNDLVQYVLAVDRSNPHTSDLYFSTHPSILRLIRMVVASANEACKPLKICGECTIDPMMIPLLIGLGIREFSVAARHIPFVKHIIRQWRILEACRFAEEALEYSSAHELKDYLKAAATKFERKGLRDC